MCVYIRDRVRQRARGKERITRYRCVFVCVIQGGKVDQTQLRSGKGNVFDLTNAYQKILGGSI